MEKIKNSFSGIIFGLILLLVGTIMLCWNESNNVKNLKTVSEISNTYIDIPGDSIKKENDGKLIATNGNLVVEDDIIEDPIFNIGEKNIKLSRKVEMYQWEENKKKDSNDNYKYTYTGKWSTHLINSDSFENTSYVNPKSMEYESQDFIADSVSLGAYELNENEKNSVSTNKKVILSQTATLPMGYQISNNYITNSYDVNSPQVGDIRISFYINDWSNASVLAVQDGTTFKEYKSKAGKSVDKIIEGKHDGSEIIKEIENENNTIKWIFRAIGLVSIILGYILLINPLVTIISFIPLLGNIVGGALNFAASLIGIVHSLIVIALAWIVVRPLLGIGLLIAAGILIFFIVKYIKKKGKKINKNTSESNINNVTPPQPMGGPNINNMATPQPMNDSNINNVVTPQPTNGQNQSEDILNIFDSKINE